MSKIRDDIIWLAGILEGEGCFRFNGKSPLISINMTDKDIIERVCLLFKSKLRKNVPSNIGHKVVYSTEVYGAKAIGIMLSIYSKMGKRRKQKIKEVIKLWKKIPLRYITSSMADKIKKEHNSNKYKTKKELARKLNISYDIVLNVTTGRTYSRR